jgi:hypothetical protein
LRRTLGLSLENVEPPPRRRGIYTTGFPNLVCNIISNVNIPTRKECVHNTFMTKFLEDTNQGTPSQGDSCAFPFFENIGAPLMPTLNIPRLNVGLPIWLWTTINVLNAPNDSQISTSFQGHRIYSLPSSLVKYDPPPFASSGEILSIGNQKYKRKRKRKNKKNKSPTFASHVGDKSPTSTSHIGDMQPSVVSHVRENPPAFASHDGGMILVTSSHTRDRSMTSMNHVRDIKPTIVSNVGGKKPTIAIHVGSKNLVTKSHNGEMKLVNGIHDSGINTFERLR